MAVHAHPDDESSKGAATMARYAAEGHRVMVVTLTGGERGDILNPAMDLPDVHGRITEIRRDEMARHRRLVLLPEAFVRPDEPVEVLGVTGVRRLIGLPD